MSDKNHDETTGVDTTGHEWDGIRELNNPLPRWWLYTLYATIIWGVAYTIAYPAWPLISGATTGLLGYSTRGEVASAMTQHAKQNETLVAQLIEADLAQLDPGDDLHRYGVARGGAVFRAQCSQCHGAGAAGAKGYPNLLDDDWLWGGSVDDIAYSVTHGIRNETDEDARYSQMPAFGELLEPEEIQALAGFVALLPSLKPSGQTQTLGATLFAENCSSCHGDTGQGDRDQGAPNLADAISLYGNDEATLVDTITNARFGVMPAWGPRLSEADIRAVSVYVHALGGGE